jgi:protein-S-isoprenylcysteine O-methyltransferase Ste14
MIATRHLLAIILVISVPPAVAFWLLAHPLARFWRRIGPMWAYPLLTATVVALGGSLYRLRDRLIGPDLGTSWPLIALGALLYGAAIWLSVLCRRQLPIGVFAGVPELSNRAHPGHLLQEGVYGVVRHPRYASVILGTTGFALAVNHAGAYVVVGAALLLLWPVIVLEERELATRFGPEYDAYRRRTPALLPRWRGR